MTVIRTKASPDMKVQVRTLVETGMVWRSGPKVLKGAIEAILAGDIARPTRNVPPAVDLHRMSVPKV